MPSVLPMELFRVSQCDMIALVRNHKKRLVNHFQEKSNSVVKSICDQHTKLKQCIASKPKLETSFRSCACGDFEIAWVPRGSRFQYLQMFCVGLAIVPTTSRVE